MEEIKVLNLYAGIGGNRKLWQNVKVTAVESDEKIAKVYKQNFPEDNVIIGDAHEFLLNHFEEFDFIWSSPPCQSHSKMVKATRHKIRKYPDMRLYEEIIFLSHFFKGKWVVENVKPYYKPLISASEFGRHLIWSNFGIKEIKLSNIKNFINKCDNKGVEELKKHLGIHYEGNLYYNGNHCPGQVLRNSVPPKLGLHIIKSAYNTHYTKLLHY